MNDFKYKSINIRNQKKKYNKKGIRFVFVRWFIRSSVKQSFNKLLLNLQENFKSNQISMKKSIKSLLFKKKYSFIFYKYITM